MVIRVLVSGAHGRMGQHVVRALQTTDDLLLVGTVDKQHHLLDQIQQSQAQVVVDFTNASSVFTNLEQIIAAGAHPVIGTSGLLPEQIRDLQQTCHTLHLGGVIAPNFSLAALLMIKCAQSIVKYFPHVEIIEAHHAGKQDSPSATALYTAKALAEQRVTMMPDNKEQREVIPGARGAQYASIPIHALRLPGVLAQQQIVFGGAGETLSITHNTLDRDSFMAGVLLACRRVVDLHELIYGLEQLVEL